MITLQEWRNLKPFAQGYAVYWLGARDGSELVNVTNPYVVNSEEWCEYERGEQQACLDAQDSEE